MPKPFVPAIFQTSAIGYQSVKEFVDISDAPKVKVIASDLETLDTAEKEVKFIDNFKKQIEEYSALETVVFYYMGDIGSERDFGQIHMLIVKLGNLIYVIQDHWSTIALVDTRKCVAENKPFSFDEDFNVNEDYPIEFSIKIFSYPDFEKLTEYGMRGFDGNPVEIVSSLGLFLEEKKPADFVPCVIGLNDGVIFYNILPFDLEKLIRKVIIFDFCEGRRQTPFHLSRENLTLTKEHITIRRAPETAYWLPKIERKAFCIDQIPWPKEMFEGLILQSLFNKDHLQGDEDTFEFIEDISEFVKAKYSIPAAISFAELGLSEEFNDQESFDHVNENVLVDLLYERCCSIFSEVLFREIYQEYGSGYFRWSYFSSEVAFKDDTNGHGLSISIIRAPQLFKELISHRIKLSRETAEISWKVANQQENMATLKSHFQIAQAKHLQLFLIEFFYENYISTVYHYKRIMSCDNISEILKVLYEFNPDYQNQLLALSARLELLESRKAELYVRDLLIEQEVSDDGSMLIPQVLRAFISEDNYVQYAKLNIGFFMNTKKLALINSVYPRK